MTTPGGRPPRSPRLPPQPPLADEVVLLRLPGEADAAAIAAACRDPEIARWIPVPVPYTAADARAFLEGVGDGWATGSDLTFAIVELASGALAGMIGLHAAGAPGRAAVGYWLAPGVRGRGLATRAVRLLAAWAFADPALERLELLTLVGNEASGRVALRAGFRREGILRRYLPFRGAPVDAVMFARLRDDEPAPAAQDGRRRPVDDPLARVPLFADLGPNELDRVRAVATEVTVAAGATLVAEGGPGDALYVVLEGELAVTKRAGEVEAAVATVGPGAVQGEIAVLEGGARRATVRAITPSRLLRVARDDLFDVRAGEPGLLRSLVATVAGRLRGIEVLLADQARLASLGTLAAGLAHELNNPAAAARSSASRLADALDEWDRAYAAHGALAAPGAGPAAPNGPVRTQAAPNVILITLDTLRSDRLSCYGSKKVDTPNIDMFATEGVRFTNAASAVPLTLPAHASIMTGLYPPGHGVRENVGYVLDARFPTLAELLAKGGWATGGFVSAFVLDGQWGIGRGYDHYFDDFDLRSLAAGNAANMGSLQRDGADTVAAAVRWLDERPAGRPFFLWLHLYDPHEPYTP